MTLRGFQELGQVFLYSRSHLTDSLVDAQIPAITQALMPSASHATPKQVGPAVKFPSRSAPVADCHNYVALRQDFHIRGRAFISFRHAS